MLKTSVLHPEILSTLASAGHLSQILISDGNYPHNTAPNPRAKIVWANFRPGVLGATAVLEMMADLVPIEFVHVMAPATSGQWALKEPPTIWNDFRRVLAERSNFRGELTGLQKPEFNQLARNDETALVIATGETAIYANVLLTIGVVK